MVTRNYMRDPLVWKTTLAINYNIRDELRCTYT